MTKETWVKCPYCGKEYSDVSIDWHIEWRHKQEQENSYKDETTN